MYIEWKNTTYTYNSKEFVSDKLERIKMTKISTYNSNQIGGNTVIIETDKSRIAIDFGANLPGSEGKNIEIEGLSTGKSTFDGVFFTHYHGDHMGRMLDINPDIPLYVGTVARQVLLTINKTLKKHEMVKLLKDSERIREISQTQRISINDGDIVVTPYTVDHSAYEAFMFLIETKDKTILHTGDFRYHGYRGKSLYSLLDSYILKFDKNDQSNVDILIIEGTMLSRMKEKVVTEADLQSKAKKFFKTHRHVFLICSSTNLDSLASFYHAADDNKIQMFGNYYVYEQIQNFSKTAGSYSEFYKFDKFWKTEFDKPLKKNNFEGTQEDFMRKFGFLCVIKEGEAYEEWIERFKDCNPVIIYSMWEGYRDKNRKAYNKELDALCSKYETYSMHTSGHATAGVIKNVIEKVNPKEAIYPIHTEHPEELLKLKLSPDLKNKIVMKK